MKYQSVDEAWANFPAWEHDPDFPDTIIVNGRALDQWKRDMKEVMNARTDGKAV